MKIAKCCVAYKRIKGEVPLYIEDSLRLNSQQHSRVTRYSNINFISPKFCRRYVLSCDFVLGVKFFGKGQTVRKLTGEGIKQNPLIKRILTEGVRRKDKKTHSFCEFTTTFTITWNWPSPSL